ncbi:MAG: CHASE2 domain-containing protein [Saprospiraceae bacterium]|nr:CHASE2 domain-containing protein [Saprospiraceae bacterium]
MSKRSHSIHAGIFAMLCVGLMYFLHHLPVNQLFIDPFSEAIKQHDIMDIAFSKFRNHNKTHLFDNRIFVVNSGLTNREKLAQTINLLNEKGAQSIGLDILIDTFYQTKADTLLKEAIQKASTKIILGYTLNKDFNNHTPTINFNSHPFFSAGIANGYVNLATNDGFSVRAFVPTIEIEKKLNLAFSTHLVSKVDTSIIPILKNRKHTSEWINFRRVQPGPRSMEFPINSGKASHYMLLDIDKFLADSALYDSTFLKNKIVLIGFCGETENSFSMNDRYFTPLNEQYTGRSLPDMYGITIHANIISMLLDKDFIEDIPSSIIYFLGFLIFFINYLTFKRIIKKYNFMQRIFIRLFQIFEFVILFTLAILLLVFWSWKLSFFFIATAIILSYELYEIYERKLDDLIERGISKLITKKSKY